MGEYLDLVTLVIYTDVLASDFDLGSASSVIAILEVNQQMGMFTLLLFPRPMRMK